MPPARFDLAALYAALDEQRQARGLTWRAALDEINLQIVGAGRRPIAHSTVSGLRTKPVAEGDGVLQMLRWLDRIPESFIPGSPLAEREDARLPRLGPQLILRFDTPKLHAALGHRRVLSGLTWQSMAEQIGGKVSAGSLMSLSKVGRRTGFPHVTRITGWLGEPVAAFTRAARS